jgi:hypothetical protein
MLDDVISDADNELINDIKKALYVLMLGDNPNQEAIELLKKGLRDE